MRKLIASLFLLFTACSCFSQIKWQAHTGVSYIEHLSVGLGCSLHNKHEITALYGSNAFTEANDFSSLLLQYNRLLNKYTYRNFTPSVGLKGGQTIFTDHYYRWKLDAIIPFAGFHYRYDKRIFFYVQGGMAISFEQTVKRLHYGEIGHYRQFLPELKLGAIFNLNE